MGNDCSTKQMWSVICKSLRDDGLILLDDSFGKGRHILHFPVRGGSLISKSWISVFSLHHLSDVADIVGFVQDREHKKLGDHTGKSSLSISSSRL